MQGGDGHRALISAQQRVVKLLQFFVTANEDLFRARGFCLRDLRRLGKIGE